MQRLSLDTRSQWRAYCADRHGVDIDNLPPYRYSCDRCEDSRVYMQADGRCYECDCDQRFDGCGFPPAGGAFSLNTLPAAVQRFAKTSQVGQSLYIQGAQLPVTAAGFAVCKEFWSRGARSVRFVDACNAPASFSERWDVGNPVAMFIGSIDRRLRPPQVRHLCDLLQRRTRNRVNVLLGMPPAALPAGDTWDVLRLQINALASVEVAL